MSKLTGGELLGIYTAYPTYYPANTIDCAIVGSMLGQRRRRWTNIEPALGQCLVFAG